jgi:uncharacterized protein with von Willebrand factor type A (vWA) domain
LRRAGLLVAPPQVTELARAISLVGWDDPRSVCEATSALVLQRTSDAPRLQAVFAEFFARAAPVGDLWTKLEAQGFTGAELAALRELLAAIVDQDAYGAAESSIRFRALLDGGVELDRLLSLADFQRDIEALRNPLQVGFFTQRAIGAIGLRDARARLGPLRQHLRGALGDRGDALADALAAELDRAGATVRDHIRRSLGRTDEDRLRPGRKPEDLPLASLTDADMEEVRLAVRAFADRLRGAARVRTRHGRRGRIDPGRTLRAMLRTGGVPFKPIRRRRRRDRPRLLLLCDVSDSVRAVSRFMLELVAAAHELFAHTRSFVFVSELGETTGLFQREPVRAALAAAYGGDVVPVTDNSNYGRAFRVFEERHLAEVDRRTTVVILGDGRTNYHDASEGTLARVRVRARALYWLSTEPRSSWATGDSAMRLYAPHCTAVLEVTTARELEAAARRLVSRR